MPFEDDLGAALRRTGDAFSPDTASLVAAGLARGRTLRRRRAAAVTGAFVAVTAAGVGAVVVVPGAASRHAEPPAKRPSSLGTPRTTVSGQEMLDIFKALLPKGTISGERAMGTEIEAGTRPSPYAELVHDDGKGASLLSVGLSVVPDGQRQNQCPDPAVLKQGSRCSRTELPGKSVLVVIRGWEYNDERVGPRNWRATLTTPEGHQVDVNEWNAATEKGTPATRPDPPLTAGQLAAVARSSRWDEVFGAFPAPAPPGGISGGPTATPT
ncbi:hypothetical protein ACFYXS_15735 [Streptomyces sp. NPDC002574]|uniref:hypothetical protein n=1 Tax=Streptomyces sp. NPDC002574 TaxID=3364652 RepID=UPI0036C57B7D